MQPPWQALYSEQERHAPPEVSVRSSANSGAERHTRAKPPGARTVPKVRSYFRYKGLPHVWIARRAENDEEYRRYARLPIIPLVVTPEGEGIQDSTPIMEAVEARTPTPSIHPTMRRLAFLSALIEEFGDEWGNKLMFHHRWYDPVDQDAASLGAGAPQRCRSATRPRSPRAPLPSRRG